MSLRRSNLVASIGTMQSHVYKAASIRIEPNNAEIFGSFQWQLLHFSVKSANNRNGFYGQFDSR